MKIIIAGDHYAVDLMESIQSVLTAKGIKFENLGTKSKDIKITLQEIIPAVVKCVQNGSADFGILACGTGVGVEIGANRFKAIRASLCRDAEQAKNARVYDNANILCLGSWYEDSFEEIVDSFLKYEFDGNERRTSMLRDFDRLTEL
ncbi:RpiB/LacA/LacB family sugar-phosphate isomerase [Candidatus Parcubacteria bacterium]|nr:RpiB/LacA/LacB family sugar-phosphate isomerase [Candidatus Parcubacteria bacterium]